MRKIKKGSDKAHVSWLSGGIATVYRIGELEDGKPASPQKIDFSAFRKDAAAAAQRSDDLLFLEGMYALKEWLLKQKIMLEINHR